MQYKNLLQNTPPNNKFLITFLNDKYIAISLNLIHLIITFTSKESSAESLKLYFNAKSSTSNKLLPFPYGCNILMTIHSFNNTPRVL